VQVVGDPYTGTSDSPYLRLNPNAFAPGTPNNAGALGLGEGRNPFYGQGMNDTDFSLQKTFYFGERIGIELRLDAFNAFNHPQFNAGGCNGSGINCTVNFAGINGGVTNAYLNSDGTVNNKNGFATVAGAADPRILQLGARIVFSRNHLTFAHRKGRAEWLAPFSSCALSRIWGHYESERLFCFLDGTSSAMPA
jgi:hypothetical protein